MEWVCHGSLPCLRMGTKPASRLSATGAAKMNPRASMPTTLSIFSPPAVAVSSLTECLSNSGLERIVDMSLKRIPGLGKSGTSRMLSLRIWEMVDMVISWLGSLGEERG